MAQDIAPQVAAAFDAFAPVQRATLLALRDLVLETAAAHPGVGEIEESLKWGEPAYRPIRPRTGTTVRLGVSPKSPGACAIFVNCKTSLLATYRDLYPDAFTFEGDRALIVPAGEPLPADAIGHCVSLALTYHQKARA
jgi:hypothetical protein